MTEQAYKNTIVSLNLKLNALENALRTSNHSLEACKQAGLKLADKAEGLISHKVKIMADVSTELKTSLENCDNDFLVFSDVAVQELIAKLDG